MLDVSEGEDLVSDKSIESTRCTDNDVRILFLVLQELNVFGHGCTAVEDSCLDLGQILAEAGVFVLDLVCQFSSVAHDQDGAFSGHWFQGMESRQDKDSSLTQTGLGLTENVLVEESGRNGILLDCGWRTMLDFNRKKWLWNASRRRFVRPSPQASQKVLADSCSRWYA